MNKTEYIDKMNGILSDHRKFQKITSCVDPTEKVEKQLIESLKRLKQQSSIIDGLYESLKPTGTVTPRLYGLPKVHKIGLPLRPVLDMCNSPYHATAKWLVKLLKPLHNEVVKHSVNGSFEFVEKIRDLNVRDKFMISFDVSSLFTNVPLIETVDFICEEITTRNIDIGISVTTLKELILRCTMNVHFLFNKEYYRQIDGVAMGSPLGPILADFFLAKLENGPLKGVINDMDFYCRYMDDTFVVMKDENDAMNILDKFNDAHSAINFTIEKESNDSISFLDVFMVRREDGTLRRSVYRKPTTTGQYTHFLSFVPLKYKRNLVKCLAHRARLICSDDCLNEELKIIRELLRKNGYPDKFIEKNINSAPRRVSMATVPKKPMFIKLQFLGDNISELITQRLKNAVKRTYYAAEVRCLFTTTPILCSRNKDKLPKFASSMCIYQFDCSCGASYIGRTIRQVHRRISEHHPTWLSKGQKRSIRSSILAHLVDTEHKIDVNTAFKIIYRIPTYLNFALRVRLLQTAEAIGIHLKKPSLCVQKKFVQPLSLPWPSSQEWINRTASPPPPKPIKLYLSKLFILFYLF
uniref:Reverse transcriptase domain-containing protein n=1 Tax=Trichobilharzia regenti TaxID=157069 RepID=A0AA85KIY4_TRIRE|nr:unnamed protein product [Trichobilharzia regenti]